MLVQQPLKTIKFEHTTLQDHDIAIPMCENAVRACQLVKRSFLMDFEVKLLERMGFEIEILKGKGKFNG